MKKLTTLSLIIAIMMSLGACKTKHPKNQWIPLFNGKDLTNWRVKIRGYAVDENFGNTFRVEDGLLKVRYDQYKEFGRRFGHIFYDESFSHYKLRVEYRIVGEQVKGGPGWAFKNSGIMLHGQPPATMTHNQDFPASLEVQLLGGNGRDDRPTSNLCTPGMHVHFNGELVKKHCIPADAPTFHDEKWVTAEVEVRGDKILKHIVNGDVVLAYTEPVLDDSFGTFEKLKEFYGGVAVKKGYISLQSESHPIDFRKVEIMILDEEK
ncbi:DUF1080 domain-containing protein [Prolixibacteraceae bacterium JC049]|nr:DUF1080 domain-containing protein [Prolixibacteraceae bacterium JC049]